MTLNFSPYAAYAFEILYCRLHKRKPVLTLAALKSKAGLRSAAHESCPLFVTWNIRDPDDTSETNLELRGCIGTFTDVELDEGIKSYALISAFEDTRFMPISSQELPYLSCSITLLKNFIQRDDPMDWTLGKNGVRVSFTKSPGGRRYSATFLPGVATEQGWNKEQTLNHLVRKAGVSGLKWNDVDMALTTYEGEKSSMDFEEFIELRKSLVE